MVAVVYYEMDVNCVAWWWGEKRVASIVWSTIILTQLFPHSLSSSRHLDTSEYGYCPRRLVALLWRWRRSVFLSLTSFLLLLWVLKKRDKSCSISLD